MTLSKYTSTGDAWLPFRRIALSVLRPVERFLQVEASSGIILLIGAVIALVWANSPWSGAYDTLWHTELGIGVGGWQIKESLHFWINDFLMAIFFLVVGVEIKREIVEGALSDIRRATLPIAAAVGGMVVPAGIYLALNAGGPQSDGWGVPMATDIAFAVGVLALLGNRVPAGLRVLLLALAIIDDIGAILVIAIFYSSEVQYSGLIVVAAGLGAIRILYWMGVRPGLALILPSVVVWYGMYMSGIHPTIAGVLVGFVTPVKSWFSKKDFLTVAGSALHEFKEGVDRGLHDYELVAPLYRITRARRAAISPTVAIETVLHPWVAFGIMPVFALANAGVHLGGIQFGGGSAVPVFAGIALGLAVGKPIGVLLVSWIAVKLRLCVLPTGTKWSDMAVVGMVAGIGFTMAIFIAELAFAGSDILGLAKLAVLVGTAVSAVAGVLAGRAILQPMTHTQEYVTASDVEASTEYWTSAH